MKVMQLKNKFENNHPKTVLFAKKVVMSGLPEGTVIEMTVTKPGGEPITANMKVTEDDLEMMNELKNLR
ncbi:MAG: hypothetical protein K5851_00480 [Lachnospiraceae bacterium]|nr:hypothetical protein [Lachnospiraceae bacterium]